MLARKKEERDGWEIEPQRPVWQIAVGSLRGETILNEVQCILPLLARPDAVVSVALVLDVPGGDLALGHDGSDPRQGHALPVSRIAHLPLVEAS